jgi:hypothetical protein
LKLPRLDLLLAGAATLGAAVLGLLLRARWRRTPAEVERRRREHVGRIGRITMAEILDVVEDDAGPPPLPNAALPESGDPAVEPRSRQRLVVYRYSVSGVIYETAQDLSDIAGEHRAPVPGQTASVKYDPAHPSNSILAAENWSGLKERRPGNAALGKGRP